MPDDLRYCMLGCCHFVNNEPATKDQYELAVKKATPGFSGVEITLIPCRKADDGIQHATERSAGFYLGIRFYHRSLFPGSTVPYVFERETGTRRGEATAEDIKKWNDARSRAVEDAKK
jgi:hypothetical protein